MTIRKTEYNDIAYYADYEDLDAVYTGDGDAKAWLSRLEQRIGLERLEELTELAGGPDLTSRVRAKLGY